MEAGLSNPSLPESIAHSCGEEIKPARVPYSGCSSCVGMMWVVVQLAALTAAFVLPGMRPSEFAPDKPVPVFVSKLESVRTELPFDYYDLPFCLPEGGKPQRLGESIGEYLMGERIETSPYVGIMKQNQFCKSVCRQKLSPEQVKLFIDRIKESYRVNLLIDSLPVISYQPINDQLQFHDKGYPLGYLTSSGQVILHNHLKLVVDIYPNSKGGFRVVGFSVEPRSIKHSSAKWDDSKPTENHLQCEISDTLYLSEGKPTEVIFSYDVVWQDSNIQWASRWDIYTKMGDSKVHWFSIVTSLTIVIFLTAMVAMILIRTLRQDLAGYNADRTEEEEKEDIGWKLVHGDVFRTPKYANLLSVLVGTGAQVFAMTVFSIIAAAVGLMDPLLRGALLTGILILFVLMGSLAGFVGTRVYTMFGLVNWRLNAFHIATLFPGVTFGIFFLLNLILWGQGSSGAIPFHEILVLLAFWFGISVPLVYIGSMIAQKRPAVTHPLKVNTIPRQIPPQPWYMSTPTVSLVSGILPFGAVFVETFFILSSIRLHRVYHFFGFLFTVFIILVVTCIEISIVMCYFQLCSGDYNWWWRSYFTSGSSALHLLIYSLVYFGTKLELIQFVSSFLFFGYIVLISMFFFVLTGTIGFVSSLVFVRKIYSSVKFE